MPSRNPSILSINAPLDDGEDLDEERSLRESLSSTQTPLSRRVVMSTSKRMNASVRHGLNFRSSPIDTPHLSSKSATVVSGSSPVNNIKRETPIQSRMHLFPAVSAVQCKPLFISTKSAHRETLSNSYFSRKARKIPQLRGWMKYFDVVSSNFSPVLVSAYRAPALLDDAREPVHLEGAHCVLRGLPKLVAVLPLRESEVAFWRVGRDLCSLPEESSQNDFSALEALVEENERDLDRLAANYTRDNEYKTLRSLARERAENGDKLSQQLFSVRSSSRQRVVWLHVQHHLHENSPADSHDDESAFFNSASASGAKADFALSPQLTCEPHRQWSVTADPMHSPSAPMGFVAATAVSRCGMYCGFATVYGDIFVHETQSARGESERQIGLTIHGSASLPTSLAIHAEEQTGDLLVVVGFTGMIIQVFRYADLGASTAEDNNNKNNTNNDNHFKERDSESSESFLQTTLFSEESNAARKYSHQETRSTRRWREELHLRIVGNALVCKNISRNHNNSNTSANNNIRTPIAPPVSSQHDWITALAFFDTNTVVVGTEQGETHLVNLRELIIAQPQLEDELEEGEEAQQPSVKLVSAPDISPMGVTCVDCSPSARKIVTGSLDGTVRVYTLPSRHSEKHALTLALLLSAHKNSVYAVAISRNGSLVYSGGSDKSVLVWDAIMGKPLRVIRDLAAFAPRFSPQNEIADRDHWVVRRLQLSQDQQLLSVVLQGGLVVFLDAAVPEQVYSTGDNLFDEDDVEDDQRRVTSIAVSDRPPQEDLTKVDAPLREFGNYLAVVGTTSSLAIYNLHNQALLFDISFETSQFSYNTDEGPVVEKKTNGLACYTSITPDGRSLAFSYSSVVSVVRNLTEDPISLSQVMLQDSSLLVGHDLSSFDVEDVTCLAITNDGSAVIVGDQNGQLLLFAAESMQLLMGFQAHLQDIRGLALANNQLMIASGGSDGAVRLWRCRDPLGPNFCRISATMYDAAATDEDKKRHWEWQVLGRHKEAINDVLFSPDDACVFTAGEDRKVIVWDVRRNGNRLVVLKDHSGPVRCLAVCRQQPLLVAGCKSREAVVWNWETGEKLRLLRNGSVNSAYRCHQGRVLSAAITSDGSMIITGTDHEDGFLNFHLETVAADYSRLVEAHGRSKKNKSLYSLSSMQATLPLCTHLLLSNISEIIQDITPSPSPFEIYFAAQGKDARRNKQTMKRTVMNFLREFVLSQWSAVFEDLLGEGEDDEEDEEEDGEEKDRDEREGDEKDRESLETKEGEGEDVLVRLCASKQLEVVQHFLAAAPHVIIMRTKHSLLQKKGLAKLLRGEHKRNTQPALSILRHLLILSRSNVDITSKRLKIDSNVLKLILDVYRLFIACESSFFEDRAFRPLLREWKSSCRQSFGPFLGDDASSFLQHAEHIGDRITFNDVCDVASKWPYLFLDFAKKLQLTEQYKFTIAENADVQSFVDAYIFQGSTDRSPDDFWQEEEESQLLGEVVRQRFLQFLGIRRNLRKGAVPAPVTPLLIPIKGIAAKNSKFLRTLIHTCAKTRDYTVFDNSVVRLVVEYKWNAFVATRYLRNFVFHCLWFASFMSSSLTFDFYLRHRDEENVRVGWEILVFIVLIFNVYFMHHEVSQLLPSYYDLLRAPQQSLLKWFLRPLVHYFTDFEQCIRFLSCAMVVSTWVVQACLALSHDRETKHSPLSYPFKVHRAMAAATLPLLVMNLLFNLCGFRFVGKFVRKVVGVMRGISTIMLLLLMVLIAFTGTFMLLMPNNENFKDYGTALMTVYGYVFYYFDVAEMYAAAVFPKLAVTLMAIFLYIVSLMILNLIITVMYDLAEEIESTIEAETFFAQAKVVLEYEQSLVDVTSRKRRELLGFEQMNLWQYIQNCYRGHTPRDESEEAPKLRLPLLGAIHWLWTTIASYCFWDVITDETEKQYFPLWIQILAKSDHQFSSSAADEAEDEEREKAEEKPFTRIPPRENSNRGGFNTFNSYNEGYESPSESNSINLDREGVHLWFNSKNARVNRTWLPPTSTN